MSIKIYQDPNPQLGEKRRTTEILAKSGKLLTVYRKPKKSEERKRKLGQKFDSKATKQRSTRKGMPGGSLEKTVNALHQEYGIGGRAEGAVARLRSRVVELTPGDERHIAQLIRRTRTGSEKTRRLAATQLEEFLGSRRLAA